MQVPKIPIRTYLADGSLQKEETLSIGKVIFKHKHYLSRVQLDGVMKYAWNDSVFDFKWYSNGFDTAQMDYFLRLANEMVRTGRSFKSISEVQYNRALEQVDHKFPRT